MKQSNKKNSFALKLLSIVLPLSLIYIIWCSASYILFHLGYLFSSYESVSEFTEPVSITVFILLASQLTMLFSTHLEKHLKENLPVRLLLLFLSLFFLIGFYFLVILTNNKSNILYCLSTANLIVFACILGNWMTGPVKRPAEIIPLCVVVAFADLFSVFSGPTKHLAASITTYYEGGMQGTPPFVDFLLVKIAIPGFNVLIPLFGVSDWIIIAFLSAAACKFKINDNLTGNGLFNVKKKRTLFFPIASAGLIVSIIIARLSNIFIPALPFVVIVFLAYMLAKYPDMRKLTRAELVPMAAFSGVMITLMVIF